jgi:regulator of replication initiation timing
MSKHLTILLAENTKMSTRITEMRKHFGKLRKHLAILLAENTKMSKQITEMRKHFGKLRKSSTFCSSDF